MKDDNIEFKIAKKLYDLFVVNDTSIAIQDADGIYRRRKIGHFDYMLFVQMLKTNSSLGCYQQTWDGKIRWICLDFDIKNKELNQEEKEATLFKLYDNIIAPVIYWLQERKINFLVEFSGRRGIHIWVIFKKTIEKKQGFDLINTICNDLKIEKLLGTEFCLDKFPQTPSAIGNKVGKQVKIPLSTHKKGQQSFFLNGKPSSFKSTIDLNNQYTILKRYKLNDPDIFKFQQQSSISQLLYKKYEVNDSIPLDPIKVIEALREIKSYDLIISNIMSGRSSTLDYLVMLGTFTPLKNDEAIFKAVLEELGAYKKSEFDENYKKFHLNYYPPTLSYLNTLYSIDDKNTKKEETAFDILIEKFNLNNSEIINWEYKNKKSYRSLSNIVEAEINYARYNDEVILPLNIERLKEIGNYDSEFIAFQIKDVRERKIHKCKLKSEYEIFIRKEIKADKTIKERMMIILNPEERVLTTALALDFYKNSKNKEYGFSYIPNYICRTEIFINWFTLWQNYINVINTYLTPDLWKNSYIMTTDLKEFYDSIDYLPILKQVKGQLSIKSYRELYYLVSYNENLMFKITGKRIGVPQGPAYARLLAEFHINYVLNEFRKNYKQYTRITLLRYVDDFFIISDSDNLDIFFRDFKSFLSKYRLTINEQKTKMYGKISELSYEDILEITRKDTIKYAFRNDIAYEIQISKDELISKLHYELTDPLQESFIFSSKMEEAYQIRYFLLHRKEIIKSEYGRGSLFNSFYSFLFSHFDNFIVDCESDLKNIPNNSLNQYVFISCLFFAIKDGRISRNTFKEHLADALTRMDDVKNKYIADMINSIINWSET